MAVLDSLHTMYSKVSPGLDHGLRDLGFLIRQCAKKTLRPVGFKSAVRIRDALCCLDKSDVQDTLRPRRGQSQ